MISPAGVFRNEPQTCFIDPLLKARSVFFNGEGAIVEEVFMNAVRKEDAVIRIVIPLHFGHDVDWPGVGYRVTGITKETISILDEEFEGYSNLLFWWFGGSFQCILQDFWSKLGK